ncbi:MAG: hypothetical protein HW403_61 [Dehalococcoidia bacterium]|nr:hypothetical protein [Dehalococcoidia bacterium]
MAAEVTWDDVRARIGEELGGESEGVEPVSEMAIRRVLEALEFDCPLHYDEAAAKSVGYKGIIAPRHMMDTFANTARWVPGMSTRWTTNDPDFTIGGIPSGTPAKEIPTPGTHSFVTEIEIEYFEPLYIGDKVIQRGRKLLSVSERETSVGKGAFTVYESRYYNQRGELLAIARRGGYRYYPHKKSE